MNSMRLRTRLLPTRKDLALVAIVLAFSIAIVSTLWILGDASLALVGLFLIIVLEASVASLALYRKLVATSEKHQNQLASMVERVGANTYRQIEALINVRSELEIEHLLPPMRGWAISPDFAELIVTEFVKVAPRNVLECGTGVSTLIVGMLLRRQKSGQLTSLEHDADYARKWKQQIQQYGLEDYVSIVHAPLRDYRIEGRDWSWYDIGVIATTEHFDFLVVDGPPDERGEKNRFPVLHCLRTQIQQGAIMLLDDASRPAENECLDIWADSMPGLRYRHVPTEKGAAVVVL